MGSCSSGRDKRSPFVIGSSDACWDTPPTKLLGSEYANVPAGIADHIYANSKTTREFSIVPIVKKRTLRNVSTHIEEESEKSKLSDEPVTSYQRGSELQIATSNTRWYVNPSDSANDESYLYS